MRFAFLTSTPLSATEGSGTFVALDTLAAGLTAAGHEAVLRPLRMRTRFHTLDRYLYNVGAAWAPPVADVVVGVDLDGFLLARGRSGRYVVSLKGIIADELRHERGLRPTLQYVDYTLRGLLMAVLLGTAIYTVTSDFTLAKNFRR